MVPLRPIVDDDEATICGSCVAELYVLAPLIKSFLLMQIDQRLKGMLVAICIFLCDIELYFPKLHVLLQFVH
jgi:hypothetical protein